MRKKVQKTGNSLCIILTKEDCEKYEIKEGEFYDLEMVRVKQRRSNRIP